MTSLVVDASVAVKWFLPEIHSDAARRLLQGNFELVAPDLIVSEFGNVLWKKARRGEISVATGAGILGDFRHFPIRIYAAESLADFAWDLATQFDQTFYDSLYLALAQALDCRLVTADRRFYDPFQQTVLANNLVWIENV